MNKKGFTLVELLIVVAILGILMTIGSTAYVNSMKKSRDGRRKTDLEMIRGALELYKSDNDVYPDTPLPDCGEDLGNYIKNMPCDPKTSGQQYIYVKNGNDYCLGSDSEMYPDAGDGSCVGTDCSGSDFCVENP